MLNDRQAARIIFIIVVLIILADFLFARLTGYLIDFTVYLIKNYMF